jgi:bifunctional non-homologous end joining protein LigD
MPTGIAPMLAVLSELPSDPANWSFEYKWDGVRALSFWNGRQLTLHSRNQLDITRRYPDLQDLGAALPKSGAILDGEILALDADGKPSFALLQRRMHAEGTANIARLVKQVPVWYVLFDVLWLRGRWLLDEPFTRRREMLEDLTIAGPAWQISPAHSGQGKEMLAAARQNALEGLVAKRIDSPYEPGRRSPNWRKIKVIFGQEFVIGGWVPEKGINQQRVGTLLVGYYDCDGKLHFAGGVGTGFNAALHASLTSQLLPLRIPSSPFVERVVKKDVMFVKPQLVAEVEFRRWPEGGQVQQASFKGIRTDKTAREVVKEGQGCSPIVR